MAQETKNPVLCVFNNDMDQAIEAFLSKLRDYSTEQWFPFLMRAILNFPKSAPYSYSSLPEENVKAVFKSMIPQMELGVPCSLKPIGLRGWTVMIDALGIHLDY